jgi:hypothetical protein
LPQTKKDNPTANKKKSLKTKCGTFDVRQFASPFSFGLVVCLLWEHYYFFKS